MAAVARGKIHMATGAEGAHKARGQAAVALAQGDPIVITTTAPSDTRFDFVVTKAGTVDQADGIVLDASVVAGDPVDFCVRGEIEGFSGLSRGTYLTVVSGNLDTTAPAAGITAQFKAVSSTRVMKFF